MSGEDAGSIAVIGACWLAGVALLSVLVENYWKTSLLQVTALQKGCALFARSGKYLKKRATSLLKGSKQGKEEDGTDDGDTGPGGKGSGADDDDGELKVWEVELACLVELSNAV